MGAWAWFPSLSCCEIWDSPNRNKTACSSSEPLRISLKSNMVKNSPLVYMSYPEPYCFIIWTDISYLELFWALSNGEFVRGRYLSSTELSPLRTHCFASLKMSGMSITYSGYCYPPSPDNSLTTKPKISTVNLSISNALSKQCSLPITLSSWSMGHLP